MIPFLIALLVFFLVVALVGWQCCYDDLRRTERYLADEKERVRQLKKAIVESSRLINGAHRLLSHIL